MGISKSITSIYQSYQNDRVGLTSLSKNLNKGSLIFSNVLFIWVSFYKLEEQK